MKELNGERRGLKGEGMGLKGERGVVLKPLPLWVVTDNFSTKKESELLSLVALAIWVTHFCEKGH